MLNGKFYTGLPEKMMNRGPNGVDRQRTNIFWPEEENTPSIHEYSPSKGLNGRRRPSTSRESSSRTSSISYDSQNSLCDDINTRDLVRKQQASKIQFYDYDDSYVPPSRTITPSSVGRNLSRESPEADLSHRKLETLKSRIEFYDYVDEGAAAGAPAAAAERRNGSGRRESEARPSPVVNKSRDSNFIQETYAPEDRTDGRMARGSGSTNTTSIASRTTINHNTQPVQNQSQKSTERRVPIETSPSEEKSRINRSVDQKSMLAKKQVSSSVIDLSTLDLDDPELEELKKLKPPTKNDIHQKLATFQTEIRVANSRAPAAAATTDRDTRSYERRSSPPRSTVRTIIVDQSPPRNHRNGYDNGGGMRQSTTTPTADMDDRRRSRDPVKVVVDPEPPNEARRMAHRHLHSSFSFGEQPAQPAAAPLYSGARRPHSIRDTAVCRVGVGLPDL